MGMHIFKDGDNEKGLVSDGIGTIKNADGFTLFRSKFKKI
jgi:hypothetical protein